MKVTAEAIRAGGRSCAERTTAASKDGRWISSGMEPIQRRALRRRDTTVRTTSVVGLIILRLLSWLLSVESTS